MGRLGRYIDSCDDVKRDRLITADEFTPGLRWWAADGCGCIVGTAELSPEERYKIDATMILMERFAEAGGGSAVLCDAYHAGLRAMDLAARFGEARIIALCKRRAAQGLTSRVVEQPQEAAV